MNCWSTASSRTVTFSWSPVTVASIYTIQIFGNWEKFGSSVLIEKANTTATAYITTLPADSYGWNIQVSDVYGNKATSGFWKVDVP